MRQAVAEHREAVNCGCIFTGGSDDAGHGEWRMATIGAGMNRGCQRSVSGLVPHVLVDRRGHVLVTQ
jgi:hypothetical protein